MNEKKPVLRFRFIVVFAVLLLAAMFVVYMLQTSLEDVLGNDGNGGKDKNTATTTTADLSIRPESGDEVVIMTTPIVPEENA